MGAYRDVPADQVSYIGHEAIGALVDKRRQGKSPHKSGDFPESNMNDDSLILQTCLSCRISGDSKINKFRLEIKHNPPSCNFVLIAKLAVFKIVNMLC